MSETREGRPPEGSGSVTRLVYRHSQNVRSFCHALVIGDDSRKVVAENPRGCEVNRVQVAQNSPVKGRGVFEQLVIELNEVKSAQESPGSSDRRSAMGSDGPKHLNLGECA